MSHEFCERDPGCVWPKGHPGDVHCHTFADPMVATQDDADREIARLEADVTALRLLVGEWYATHVKDTPPTVGLVERTRETLR